jgi:hypothetical protein
MSFGTNPFGAYHHPSSKEHIDLNKQATILFQPKQKFKLSPENSQAFCSQLTEYSEIYACYGHLKNIPTTRTIAGDGTITFGDNKSILTSWNEITNDIVQKYATETWGAQDWTVTDDKEIVALSAARGEVVGNNLTVAGKSLFMKRKRSTWLAYQLLQMVDTNSKDQIINNRDQFTWTDPDSGETVKDGMTVLFLMLQYLRPNIRINIFNELKAIKDLHPKDFGYNVSDWLSSMESKRLSIALKSSTMYPDDIFINDIFDSAEKVPCTPFVAEISRIKNSWNLGELNNLTRETAVSKVRMLYINMEGDGTFKTSLQKNDQIIALATKVQSLEKSLRATTVALTTIATNGSNSNNNQHGTSSTGGGSSSIGGSGKQPHTVEPWKLEHKGSTILKNGRTYHWCTKDHWSNNTKYNGMYQPHSTEHHDAWRKAKDEEKGFGKSVTSESESSKPEAEQKKLLLSEKLRTALTTQAGLSHDAYTRIWAEANLEN